MGGTSIKRKERKNRVKAKKRLANVKRLTKKPVLKNIDIEAIKETFSKGSKVKKSEDSNATQPESNKKAEVEKIDKIKNLKSDADVSSVKSGKETEKPTSADQAAASQVTNQKQRESKKVKEEKKDKEEKVDKGSK